MEKELEVYDNSVEIIEVELDKAIQNFLERRNYENYDIQKVDIETNEDIDFVKISHISYDRSKSETDLNLIDFQQLLSAVASKSQKFVYMIESSAEGINLYLGTHTNDCSFLKDSFEGIYSGSAVETKKENQPQLSKKMKHSKAMLGIPALKRDSDKEYKQSLEKILFPMQGKKFRIVLVAESYDLETIQDIISNYQTLGSEMHRLVKQSKNLQQSIGLTDGSSSTNGTSNSKAETKSISNSKAETKGSSRKSMKDIAGSVAGGAAAGAAIGSIVPIAGTTVGAVLGAGAGYMGGMIFGRTKNKSSTETETRTNSSTNTQSTNKSKSTNSSKTNTDTIGITFDEMNKSAEYCENLIDTYIERFQKGLNHGMWNSSLYIQAEEEVVLSELEHTLKSVYSGDNSYYETIRFSGDLIENKNINISKLPMLYFNKDVKHPIHPSFIGFSSAINTEELSILSALPNNDVAGLSVSRISSFGLTQAKKDNRYEYIKIGEVLNKKKSTKQKFRISTKALNSHLFVSGITGSGKSNTIKLILNGLQSDALETKVPFLVIEPAKSEYKNLLTTIPNLQVFRPGAKDDIFKFNPFVFEHNKNNKSVTLTKHVDMLKTTFSSAFPMYGPMPYILEDAIHKIYEDKGWNFNTEDNRSFAGSSDADYDEKSLLFPNMEDLRDKIESVVEESGYAGELDSNIKAALKTRINNLTIGIKGKIFNSRHSFDSKILFENPTVVELSNIVDDDEKAFLMGLLLNKLYQYRDEQGRSEALKHITVIEEAHRLLPNISFNNSNEEATSKARAVETFTNILAEVRSYGEGIIIADQIASKLHPDVIKNTNIKIIQRTMDREDRELVGNSINLNEDQILDIAELKIGEAIVHNEAVHQAFMVKIENVDSDDIPDEALANFSTNFLAIHKDYKYEIIYEENFAIKEVELLEIKDVNKQTLKLSMLKLLNSLFFIEDEIADNWHHFKSNIKDNKNDNIYYYLMIEALNEFGYILNQQYYNNAHKYLLTYESFLNIIKALINNNTQALAEARQDLQKVFFHKNIKEVFPSMKHYGSNKVDYTLLLLENITLDEEVYCFMNKTMKENIALNDRFDKILYKIFNTTSIELRHSLGAIRYGKKEINLDIVKEGF